MIGMSVNYVYDGRIIAKGNLVSVPREGDFIEFQAADKICMVEATLFKVLLDGSVGAIIYLTDIMPKTETKLRSY